MGVAILREAELEGLRQSLALLSRSSDAHAQEAADRIRAALREVEQPALLTTAEAAEALGVRSVNTIKLWVKTGYIHGVKRGSRTLIPASEIERIESDDRVKAMRVVDRLHEESSDLGTEDGLTDEQMLDLITGRPGTPPWRR